MSEEVMFVITAWVHILHAQIVEEYLIVMIIFMAMQEMDFVLNVPQITNLFKMIDGYQPSIFDGWYFFMQK
jgi:hypothetical protein